MQISIRTFSQRAGALYPLYTMTARSGLTVSVLPLGAALQKIAVQGGDGREISLALGFPVLEPYESLECYAGAVLGPNAGRIRGGRLPLPEGEVRLSPNEGGNQLHGGAHSLSSQLWEVEDFSCEGEAASITLRAGQPHGLDGWPGNRAYRARYTLREGGRLTLEYEARTDRPAYFNLSSHAYWNLRGDFTRSALDQELSVRAGRVCVNDGEHLPVELLDVKDTAFDFRRPRSLSGAARAARDPVSRAQLAAARGFNHAYLLDGAPGLKRACALRDPESGRSMELWTDAPGVVVYSGGFLRPGMELNSGRRSVPSCAVALEAQDLPDCARLRPADFRPTLPGEVWRRVIQFRLPFLQG